MRTKTAVATDTSRRGELTAPLPALDRLRKWVGGSFAPYLFISPFFVAFIAFGLYPLLYAFVLSFTRWHGAGTPEFIGLGNYTFLLTDSFFWGSIITSLLLWLWIVPAQTLIAIIVAALLSRPRPLQSFFRTVFLVPYLVPLVAIAQVWLILFDKDFGAVNQFLHLFAIPNIGWLTTEFWARATVALLVFWKGFGFAVLIMLAAIQTIPADIYEAAAIDGATGVSQFRFITVPLMRRTIAFFMVVSTLGVLQMFAEPYVLTAGGPYNATTTAGFALLSYTRNLDLGTGAANSFLLMIIVTIVAFLMLKFLRAGAEA
jgi:ABC-type sugar transport system permease subunit